MHMENLHKHENSKDTGYMWHFGQRGTEVRMSDLLVVAKEQNTHAGKFLLGSSETTQWVSG